MTLSHPRSGGPVLSRGRSEGLQISLEILDAVFWIAGDRSFVRGAG